MATGVEVILRGRSGEFLVLVAALLGPGGCRRASSIDRPSDRRLARGDRVVVEVRAGEFVEGTVTRFDGGRARVQATQGAEVLEVDEGDALSVATAARARDRGAYAVCGRGGGRWTGCRVVEVVNGQVTVEFADGKSQVLPGPSVLLPGELTRLNLERAFARAAARAAFSQSVRAAGAPPIASGWRPLPEERVLIRRDASWFTGQVHELERDGLYVRVVGDPRPVRLSYGDVRPLPPYPVAPWVGGFVLVRPEAEARPWETWRLAAFEEDETATLVDDRGERMTRSLRDLVPIGVPPAAPGPDPVRPAP